MSRHGNLIDDKYWTSMAGDDGSDEVDDGHEYHPQRRDRDFVINDGLGYENVGDDHHLYRPETLNDLLTVLERIRDEEFDGNGDVPVSSVNRIQGVETVRTQLSVDWGVDDNGEDPNGEVILASSSHLPLEHDDGLALKQLHQPKWDPDEVDAIVSAMKLIHTSIDDHVQMAEYRRVSDERPDIMRLARIADGMAISGTTGRFADLNDDTLRSAAEEALRVSND